jgi:hypothetical protein
MVGGVLIFFFQQRVSLLASCGLAACLLRVLNFCLNLRKCHPLTVRSLSTGRGPHFSTWGQNIRSIAVAAGTPTWLAGQLLAGSLRVLWADGPLHPRLLARAWLLLLTRGLLGQLTACFPGDARATDNGHDCMGGGDVPAGGRCWRCTRRALDS